MAEVTGLTAEKMTEIANETIVAARLSNNNLIFTTREGTDINVGKVLFTDSDIAALINTANGASRQVVVTISTNAAKPAAEAAANAYLASNPAVVNAAATAAAPAVQAELANAGVVRNGKPILNTEFSFVITDSANRMSWLQVGPNGGPTEIAFRMMRAPLEMSTAGGRAYAITDSANRYAFAVDVDGSTTIEKLSPRSIEVIRAATASKESSLLCAGDSMTAGSGGTPYTTGLSEDLGGRTVIQFGYGGQGARSITARTGAHPVMISVTNNVIPASGSVTITARDGNLDTGTYEGSLCGIPGTMVVTSGNAMTFTRTTAGTARACPPGTPFYTRPDFRGLQVVSWMGRNGGIDTSAMRDQTIAETRLALSWAGHNSARSLVLSVVPFTTDGSATLANILTLNDMLRQAFPAQFVDVAARMRSVTALAEEGITATTQDQTDIDAGYTPSSFRSDAGHFNTTGYRHVRRILVDELKSRKATA